MPISVMRGRDDAQRGSDHFYRGENAYLLSADADVIHRKNYHPRIGNSFAETDQDVAQEQMPHWLIELAHAPPKIPLLWFGFCRASYVGIGVAAQLPLHQNCDRGEKDRNDERDPHAMEDS